VKHNTLGAAAMPILSTALCFRSANLLIIPSFRLHALAMEYCEAHTRDFVEQAGLLDSLLSIEEVGIRCELKYATGSELRILIHKGQGSFHTRTNGDMAGARKSGKHPEDGIQACIW
jgi:hypothetical protein